MTLVALAAVGLIGGLFVVFMPRHLMPALALAVLVVLPVGYMDIPRITGRYFTPAVIILAVWVLRMMFGARDSDAAPVKIGALLWLPVLGVIGVSALLGVDLGISITWVAVALICVVLPYHYGRIRRDQVWESSQTAFLWIGVFIGGLAVLDFVAGFNPWSSLFSYDVTEKVWSVFRTRTSLGHPLVTSTVATMCAMIALFGSDRRPWLRIAALLGSGAAVILAVSRTGVLALAVGLALGCFVLLFGASPSKRTRRITGFFLLVSAVGFLGVVTNSPLLDQRNDSSGGVKSSDYREQSTPGRTGHDRGRLAARHRPRQLRDRVLVGVRRSARELGLPADAVARDPARRTRARRRRRRGAPRRPEGRCRRVSRGGRVRRQPVGLQRDRREPGTARAARPADVPRRSARQRPISGRNSLDT